MNRGNSKVLIVDDDKDICTILSQLVKREGHKALVAYDGYAALKMILSEMPDVLLLDIKMPDMDGMEVLRRVKETDPDLSVIMITGYANIEGSVAAIKAGAHDYLAKPFDNVELMGVIHRALAERKQNSRRRFSSLHNDSRESFNLMEMMGSSDAAARIISKVERVAKSDFTVVIVGETGSERNLLQGQFTMSVIDLEVLLLPSIAVQFKKHF